MRQLWRDNFGSWAFRKSRRSPATIPSTSRTSGAPAASSCARSLSSACSTDSSARSPANTRRQRRAAESSCSRRRSTRSGTRTVPGTPPGSRPTIVIRPSPNSGRQRPRYPAAQPARPWRRKRRQQGWRSRAAADASRRCVHATYFAFTGVRSQCSWQVSQSIWHLTD